MYCNDTLERDERASVSQTYQVDNGQHDGIDVDTEDDGPPLFNAHHESRALSKFVNNH